jgi:hypothetical protein
MTKTDAMELKKKRHRHSNCSSTIPAMLCYVRCIIRCNELCFFFSLWEMRVVYFKMKFRLYGYILGILKTQLSYTILQTVFSCTCLSFLDIAVSCQCYSNNKLILNCFHFLLFIEKETCAPHFSAHINAFMQKYSNFLQDKVIWNVKYLLERIEVVIVQPPTNQSNVSYIFSACF